MIRGVAAGLLLLGVGSPARAATCRTDMDCMGDRICVEGECRFPEAPPATPPPPPGVHYQLPPSQPTVGWARGAAIAGYVMAGVTLTLAAGSEAAKGNLGPSMTLGGGATLVFAVSVPIVSAGAASARATTGVEGAPGLRVTSWVLYGVSLAAAGALIGTGFSVEPPDGAILLTGLLGAGAQALMSADALASHNQARARIEMLRGPSARRGRGDGLAWVPVLGSIGTADGGGGTLLGIAGEF